MSRARFLASAVAACGIGVLAGCGPAATPQPPAHYTPGANAGGSVHSPSTAATPPAAQNPTAVLMSSEQRTTAQSYTADLALDTTITLTGGPPGASSAAAPEHMHVDLHLAVESAHELTASGSLTFLGRIYSVRVIEHAGVAYGSTDGGATWLSQPGTAANFSMGPDQVLHFLHDVGDVTDHGPSTVDGVRVEQYQAALDPSKASAAFANLFKSTGGGSLSGLRALTGLLKVAVDTGGRLVLEDCNASATTAMALGQGAAPLTMAMQLSVHGHFYDYGASVTVTAPPASSVHPAPGAAQSSPSFSNISAGLGSS